MLRVRLVWGGSGVVGPSVSTFHFGGSTQEEADNAVDNVTTWAQGVLADVCGASTTVHVEASVDVVDPATGDVTGQFTTTPPAQSSGPSSAIAGKASQALVTWRTENFFGGRRLQGRTFIPAVKQAAMDSVGNLTTTIATSVTSRSTTLAAGTTPALHVYSRRHATSRDVVSAVCSTELAVLRSRRD